ncbi:MAG: sigma-70 family RNA polymerase sigma factor [Planctomyces sp.]|nr:sigma-70 family RNA polymerase sigma factor [Planctomyces sp.]
MSVIVISPTEMTQLWRSHASALVLLAKSRCGAAVDQAEDCVQEAFIRLASQEPVPADCLAWLVRVVRNAAIDASRSQKRRVARESTAGKIRGGMFEPDPLTSSSATEDMERALASLDPETREIIVAHIWNNMTFRQIAEVFEISHATANRRYEAGIVRLRLAVMQVEILTNTKN